MDDATRMFVVAGFAAAGWVIVLMGGGWQLPWPMARRIVEVWGVPLSAAGAVATVYLITLLGADGRWLWIVPAVAGVLVLGGAAATWARLDGRWWVGPRAAAAVAVLGGVLTWPSYYDDQGLGERLVAPVGVLAVLGLLLWTRAGRIGPLARPETGPGRGATIWDAAGVAAACAALVPVVVLSGNVKMAGLLMPLPVVAVLAALWAGILCRWGGPVSAGESAPPHPLRGVTAPGDISLGVLTIAVALPIGVIVAWSNTFDFPALGTIGLALTAVAALGPALPLPAAARFGASLLLAAAAVTLSMLAADVSAYDY